MFRLFESLVDAFQPVHEPNPPDRFWAYIRSQMQPYRRLLGVVAFTGIGVAAVETGLIYYAGRLVDLLAAADPGTFWQDHGMELALVVLAILLVRPLVIVLNIGLLNHAVSTNLMDQVRWRAHKHLLGQSMGFFQNDFAGRIANRVMQTGPAVEDSAYMAFEAIWYATAYFIGALIIVADADPRLAIPMLIWFGLYVWLLRRLIPPIGEAAHKMSDARSMVTGRIVDAYTNIQTVKLFAHAEREERYAMTAMKIHRLRFARLLRLMTTMTAGLATLNGFLIVTVVGAAVWFWTSGQTSVGSVAAAAALTLRMNAMTGWIMWVTSQLFQHAGQIKEGMETISVPHKVVDRPGAGDLTVTGGGIRFAGVQHHYGKEKGGVDIAELAIAPGERVGLVGRSGAGKSTLVNLLLRFHDVEAGRIEIDGQDIADVTQGSLRRHIAMVTQDTSLLHRSVRDNIRYGREEVTDAQVWAAAKRVSADAFIPELVDPQGRTGLDAHVGERGVKLSGGQRQRVALARAVLKDAPILVLDEATSALDSEVEAEIQTALYDFMAGKTVIAIAHRLSTIARMDRIVVLEQGRIAEQGPHDALLSENGLYARFWNRQSGGLLGVAAE